MRLAVLAVVVSLSSTALAQPPSATPPREPTRTQPRKNPAAAVALSVTGTFASYALLVGTASSEGGLLLGFGSLFVGPSIGQWYAGKAGGFTIGARVLGFALAMPWFGRLEVEEDYECETEADCDAQHEHFAREERNANIMLAAGLTLWFGSTIYDWYAAHRAATSWNREHAVTFAPTITGSGPTRSTGVAMSLRF